MYISPKTNEYSFQEMKKKKPLKINLHFQQFANNVILLGLRKSKTVY